jgi:hypothetical protein
MTSNVAPGFRVTYDTTARAQVRLRSNTFAYATAIYTRTQISEPCMIIKIRASSSIFAMSVRYRLSDMIEGGGGVYASHQKRTLVPKNQPPISKGRPRTTGCAEVHYGSCRNCAKERKRRQRKRRRGKPDIRDTTQKHMARARAYVASYLKRGAIVPPGACEKCHVEPIPNPRRPGTQLSAWHPDPAKKREIAWLCRGCRIVARATREPIEITWTWPGIQERHLGPLPPLTPLKDLAAAACARLGPNAMKGLVDTVYVTTILENLTPAVRERLYAEGVRDGATWKPYRDTDLDPLLRHWIKAEHQNRTRTLKEAAGRVLRPIPARTPKPRAGVAPRVPEPPKTRFPVAPPLDQDAFDRVLEEKFERAAEADRLVDEANARAIAAIERMRRRPKRVDTK